MYKLTVFIPNEHLEPVKSALFEAGAGKIGEYDNCCWQVQGTGQFRPLVNSNPHIGKQGTREQVEEWRVEMVVADQYIHDVITALKQAHPYETPAYDVIKMVEINF